MFWTREHIECSNRQKCVPSFEPLHCLAHIELVHSLFSTTSPTRQLPAVRSLLCLVEMDLMKNLKKNQSWRPRRWLCRLLPELQMCKFHAWSDSGKTHIHQPPARTPMYSMINYHPHYDHFDDCFVTLSRVCTCVFFSVDVLVWFALLSWFWRTSNPPTRQNESGVQLILFNTITHNLNHSEG